MNFISKPIRKIVNGVKDKVASLFQTNARKDYGKQIVYGRGKKLSKLRIQKQFEETTKSIRNLFKQKNKIKQLKIHQDTFRARR